MAEMTTGSVRLRPIALPVEHGGWGFLGAPIVLGLWVAPSVAGFWLSLAALGVFLTRQPLKLALGDRQRGKRYPRTVWAERFVVLYGAGITMRKSIFLGDANALIIPQSRLRELLAIVHDEFVFGGRNGMKGIYAFIDIFGAERKTFDDYRDMRDAQVKRVYLGLESGDEEVFRCLNKPGSPAACIEAVRMIKSAGINAGIILLAGAGGTRLDSAHVTHSLAALAAMNLGAGDLVYVSPLIVSSDSPYMQSLRDFQSEPLQGPAIHQQLEHLKSGAKAVCGSGAKVALYHLEEFIY